MEEPKDLENYLASMAAGTNSTNLSGLEFFFDHHNKHEQQPIMKPWMGEGASSSNNNNEVIDYMLHNPQQQQILSSSSSSGFCSSTCFDNLNLSFADVMQFADFGNKLTLNQNKIQQEEETGINPAACFLKFSGLNDNNLGNNQFPQFDNGIGRRTVEEEAVQLSFHGAEDHLLPKNPTQEAKNSNNKRKTPRSALKTIEEVESERMSHIAMERNRRRQINVHLRFLKSLMPPSYGQRGDQASVIGGAIEFVKELEQLLQCLESKKRRRILEENPLIQHQPQNSLVPLVHDDQIFETGLALRDQIAENKSLVAEVEVKLLGLEATIKILSMRRPGLLTKVIAALEGLQLNILHTNITTIAQTVMYSFNVKVPSESRFNAEDMASWIQQIFSFIHAGNNICDVI